MHTCITTQTANPVDWFQLTQNGDNRQAYVIEVPERGTFTAPYCNIISLPYTLNTTQQRKGNFPKQLHNEEHC
jgi:hypothetical protein